MTELRAPSKNERLEFGVFETPQWACEAIIDRYYSDLTPEDLVVEPTCGTGHWLDALPANIPAIGIERSVLLATEAHRRTGRQVLVGDVRTIPFEDTPTLILGNPPFTARVIDPLLERAHEWLPEGGRCGLILPSFLMDRVQRVTRERRRWETLSTDTLPRELWPRLRFPVAFVRFEKRSNRTMVGFALFEEMALVRALSRHVREKLTHGRSPVWRAVVFDALRSVGGEATLRKLYEVVAPRRPTSNPHWREKIRQTLQRHAVRSGPATWRLPEAA